MNDAQHDYDITKIKKGEFRETLSMVRECFNTYNAKDYTASGRASFLNYASLGNYVKRQKYGHITFIARENGFLAGMVEIRGQSHITMLFVAPGYIKRGCGRALLTYAINHISSKSDVRPVKATLNSSPFAHDFYLRMGFVDDGDTVDSGGLIYTPMRMYLSDFRLTLDRALSE
ncbi:MAG: GNAT family N-acetyltransferase [Oscillospiraceae bacterium]|nr:GNAT family N-acetyltransferase [Oscillospiraceae bacterium]